MYFSFILIFKEGKLFLKIAYMFHFCPVLVPICASAYSVDVPIIASAIEYIPTNNTKIKQENYNRNPCLTVPLY